MTQLFPAQGAAPALFLPLAGICVAASYGFPQESAVETAALQPLVLSRVLEELVTEDPASQHRLSPHEHIAILSKM